MKVQKGFSGILLIKKVWDGSFIIHYEDDCEDSNAIKDFVSFLEADLIKREQSEKFEEIKRKYL